MTTTHTGPEAIKRCKDRKKAAQQKHTLNPAKSIMEVARHSGTDTKRVLCNGTAWQHMCTLASSHRENKVLQTSLVQLSSQQRWTQRIRSTSMLCLTACHTPKIHLLLLTHLETLQNVKGVLVLVGGSTRLGSCYAATQQKGAVASRRRAVVKLRLPEEAY